MPLRLPDALARPFRVTAADFRRRSTAGRVALASVLAFLAAAVAVLAVVLYAVLLISTTPSARELRQQVTPRASVVLAADGSELGRFETLNRVWVPLDSIAPVFLEALLVVEDRRFFEHGGVDGRRLVRAALRTLGGDTEGGSTLTQQLARNLYPEEIGRRATLRRKLREAITARRIERAHAKEQILEAYVNTVPFLYNAYGVEMAARTYFGTHAYALDTLQAATLVAMLRGTSYYNPVRHPERARERRNLVLRLMARHGLIAEARAEALAARALELDFERQDGPLSRAPHFTRYVRHWLAEWADRRGYDLFADGLVIHTPIDPALQAAAEAVVRAHGDALQAAAEAEWGPGFRTFWARNARMEERLLRNSSTFRNAVAEGADEAALLDSLRADTALRDSLRARHTRLEIGFVALEPATGHVKAWVGSRDPERAGFDHVAQARRQPGSTFKPFVYAAALAQGFRPNDLFVDEVRDLPVDGGRQTWRPTNAGGVASGRPMTLTEGLAYSLNTVTAQLMLEVGPPAVVRTARALGVRESALEAVPALALGVSEVTLLELVAAYAALAAEGVYRAPVPVTRVETRDGRLLATFGSPGERVLDREVAQTVTLMLRGAVERGTARRVRSEFGITADVAGKTGTTQHGADGWFVLMHPDLVAGAWVGFPEPAVTFRTSRWGMGSRNALPVVADVVRQARLSDRRFTAPPHLADPEALWRPREEAWQRLWAEVPMPELDDLPPLEDDLDFTFPEFTAETEAPENEEGAEPEPTAVQRLYERAGEDLTRDLERARRPPRPR